MIESPLNYTGGKSKILDQLIPLFPKGIDCFIDLFCGGCNVGLNVESNRVVYNDYNKYLIKLYSLLLKNKKENTIENIYDIINEYKLSLVSKNGYDYYGCDSSNGVANYNRDKYNRLRADFNHMKKNKEAFIYLYVLIVYAFNNQIRFNSKGEFNLPVGKRDFNKNIENKLNIFIDRIKHQDCMFKSDNFIDFDISKLKKNDFVYVDPPYLISCASYNENSGWTDLHEKQLLNLLDDLDDRKIRFALSNVLESKGNENIILKAWLQNNPKYNVHNIVKDYSNSNYQRKTRNDSVEVLITNY